jgi:hypothetical protein
MPDNLAVNIVVDSKGFTAGIELIKAQLRGLNKEVKAASDEFLRTGDSTRFDKASAAIDQLTGQLRRLQQQQKAVNRELSETATLSQRVGRQFADFGKALTPLARNLSDIRAGLIGAVAGEAIRKGFELTIQLIDETNKKILELKRVSAGTGFATPVIEEMRETAKEVGQQAGDADALLGSLRKSIDSAQVAQINLGRSIGDSAAVLRGNLKGAGDAFSGMITAASPLQQIFAPTSQVLKGGQLMKINITDAASAFQRLNIDVAGFNESAEQQAKLIDIVATRLQVVHDVEKKTQEADLAARFVTNKNYRESIELLHQRAEALRRTAGISGALPGEMPIGRRLGEAPLAVRPVETPLALGREAIEYNKQLAAQRAAQRREEEPKKEPAPTGVTPEQTRLAQEQTKAQVEFGKRWEAIQRATVAVLDPILTRLTRFATLSITDPGAAAQKGLEKSGEQTIAQNQQQHDAIVAIWKDLPTIFADYGKSISETWTATLDYLLGRTQATKKAIDTSVKAGGDTQVGPPESGYGFAGGGRVPGAGGGDTVPAMLTPGEFVTRAAAVRRYGAGLFEALNQQRFEFGGLVDAIHSRPGPHFAEGGLVGAAASTPVHLHIGGGTYPMSASSGVAAALVGAAKHSQMVSSGIKPSWYGR